MHGKGKICMTTVYFVRHAEPNYENHVDRDRELTAKGLADTALVTRYLADKKIDAVFSSPYKRAVDTIKPFAESAGLPIVMADGFKERAVDNAWIEDFEAFSRQQWQDFSYKLAGGESLQEVQDRSIRALSMILSHLPGKNIVIGSHGTALSTVIRYFDPSYGYEEFAKIKGLFPWIVRFEFRKNAAPKIEYINVFEQ